MQIKGSENLRTELTKKMKRFGQVQVTEHWRTRCIESPSDLQSWEHFRVYMQNRPQRKS